MRIDYDPNTNVLIIADAGDAAAGASPTTGDVLRAVRVNKPKTVLVSIAPGRLDAPCGLIEELRRRCPGVPLIALASRHDEHTERAARAAGAAYYFPLADESDRAPLDEALAALGIELRGPAPPRLPGRRRSRASPSRRPPRLSRH
jgi:hypothetical protein